MFCTPEPPRSSLAERVTVTVWFVQVPAVYGLPPAVALAVLVGAVLSPRRGRGWGRAVGQVGEGEGGG